MSPILVVAAHPDDELLGVGGTLVKHLQRGDEVHALMLSEGATSRYTNGMAGELAMAAKSAAEVLGLSSLTFRALPDQRLDVIPLIEVTQGIEEVINRLRPKTVYTHWPHDVNADHGIVARATWTACRPYAAPFVRRIAAFETPSSTEWSWPLSDAVFAPHIYIDITLTLDIKLAAMAKYRSELRNTPHPRSLDALRERAAYWGSHIGAEAAEPLVLLRAIE